MNADFYQKTKQTPHEKLQPWRLYGLNYACSDYSAVYLRLLCEMLYITITFVKQLANLTLVLMHMLLFLFVADNMLREEVVELKCMDRRCISDIWRFLMFLMSGTFYESHVTMSGMILPQQNSNTTCKQPP